MNIQAAKFNNFVPAFVKSNKKDTIVLRSFSELAGLNMAAAKIIPTVDLFMVITEFNKRKVTGYRFTGQFDANSADIIRPGYGDKVSLVRVPNYLADKANLNHTVI